jgi:hypothetical protein
VLRYVWLGRSRGPICPPSSRSRRFARIEIVAASVREQKSDAVEGRLLLLPTSARLAGMSLRRGRSAVVGEVTGAQRVPVGRHRDLSREPLSSVLRIVLQKEKRAGPDRSSQHSDYGTRLISPLVAD